MCKIINDVIKKVRKSKNLTQKQLSEITGLSLSYIQQLEYGMKENPSLETLNLIADALCITINDLTEKQITENNRNSELPTDSNFQRILSEKQIKSILSNIVTSISEKQNTELPSDNQIKIIVNDTYKYIEFLLYKDIHRK